MLGNNYIIFFSFYFKGYTAQNRLYWKNENYTWGNIKVP